MHINDIYDQFYSGLKVLAGKLLKDSFAADDIVQEVMIKFLQKEVKPSRPEDVKPYLHVMTTNACVDYMKAPDRRVKYQDMLKAIENPGEAHPAYVIENLIYETEFHIKLRDIIKTFPTRCCQVMTLFLEEGKTDKEIAALLSIKESNVRKQKSLGLKKLATFINKDDLKNNGFNFMVITLLYLLLVFTLARYFHFFLK